MDPVEECRTPEVMRTLAKMKLVLRSYENKHPGTESMGLKQALSWASNLEHPHIDMRDKSAPSDLYTCDCEYSKLLSETLGGYDFRRLKFLILAGFWVNEEELVRIITSAQNLTRLAIEDISLLSRLLGIRGRTNPGEE